VHQVGFIYKSVKQDGVEVQNVDFDFANNTEHSILGKMSNKSYKLCKDSDNSTKPLQITQDDKQTNNTKELQKFPRQDQMTFYRLNIPYRKVHVYTYEFTCCSILEY